MGLVFQRGMGRGKILKVARDIEENESEGQEEERVDTQRLLTGL
jgi:hypothetical protein